MDSEDPGEVVFQVGSDRICRHGVAYRNQRIRWEDVRHLFVSGERITHNFMVPGGEEARLTFVSSSGQRIDVRMSAWFRLGRDRQQQFADVYRYVVSQVLERQYNWFKEKLDSGRRVSFKTFGIAPDGIYQETTFSGTKLFNLRQIVGSDVRDGNFYLAYLDANGKTKQHKLGALGKIPNIHVAEAFIIKVAEENRQKLSS